MEQISPNPQTYGQGSTAIDPAPAGIDFQTCANSPFGDVTANLEYVPGLGDSPDDFIGFTPGNIAVIDRGAVAFVTKVVNADNAGASGVLIANTFPSGAGGVLVCGGDFSGTSIPSMLVSFPVGQDLITSLGLGPVEMHMAVTPPPPAPPLGPGIWDARIIAIDDQNGATDHDVNDTFEALAILDFADGGANANGWNIRYDVSDNRNVIDMAGGGGSFPGNHPYPNGEATPSNSPGAGEDFVVAVQTVAPIIIPEGDWTIAFGSDDGGAIRMPGITFTNKFNTDGDPGLPDTVLFNAPRGHGWTAAEFTVGPGGTLAVIEGIMYERGGGDSFEIAIAPGHLGQNGVINNGIWQLLGEGTHGWTAIPEPSTFVLGLIGMLFVAVRRRKVR